MPWSWCLPGATAGRALACKHIARRQPRLKHHELLVTARTAFIRCEPAGTAAMQQSYVAGYVAAYQHHWTRYLHPSRFIHEY